MKSEPGLEDGDTGDRGGTEELATAAAEEPVAGLATPAEEGGIATAPDGSGGEELAAMPAPTSSNSQGLLPFQKTSTGLNDEELKNKYAPGSAPYWIGPAAINAHERARR